MSDQIAFLRPQRWPLANVRVADALAAAFPDHELDVIDVLDLVKRHRLVVALNGGAVIRHYGWDLLRRRRRFKDAFWRTPYLHAAIRRLLAARLAGGNHAFTFQMQSLFDGSQPGIPHFVYTDHTHLANLHYASYDRRRLYSSRWVGREREIYEHADRIFVRSGHVANSLADQYGIDPALIECVYAGSNVEDRTIEVMAPSYGAQSILFVGSDWHRKGGPDLVRAFESLRDEFPKATLTIVGCSPDVHVPGCSVVGHLSNDALLPYYRRASIFCLPTHLEPFGIAFLEAMSAGLPIVGTNVGAVPEFLHDHDDGLLVEPGDVDGLRTALATLLADPELCRRYGERGRQLIADRYSWPVVAAAMRTSILKVLSKH